MKYENTFKTIDQILWKEQENQTLINEIMEMVK